MSGDLEPLVEYGIDMVRRAPHLYALTAAYWGLIATVLATRYLARRQRASEVAMRAVVGLGAVSLVLAFVDVAVRGQELIQISLVAYFATPLGVGYYFIRRWDGRPVTGWGGVALRQITYVLAFLAFVALSVVDGDPWWFSRPEIDRSDPVTMLETTNWLQLMATVFGLVVIIEAVSPVLGGSDEKTGRRG
ncbi:hypothetical protein JQS43_16035 [Natronosporangium hydrolyticum]|uniref:Uncharacterized protein n=1 Tax=Natronosporangium hydrolyticum TaxID=2811111 RepID=A0A895YA14_9ACTN|nr:hypothetical protein [Natronosporangium hydrolyticum]QSB13145.1 hypothetical protein JQS43_16035 [Natronosporangium hydrolyticum]